MSYKNRTKQKEAQRRLYYAQKEKYCADQKKARDAKKKWFREEIVAKSSCKECGENHPAVLDFHHRDPSTKISEVGTMVKERKSQEKILAEIEKCDVLCANCHRKHHYYERNGGLDETRTHDDSVLETLALDR